MLKLVDSILVAAVVVGVRRWTLRSPSAVAHCVAWKEENPLLGVPINLHTMHIEPVTVRTDK